MGKVVEYKLPNGPDGKPKGWWQLSPNEMKPFIGNKRNYSFVWQTTTGNQSNNGIEEKEMTETQEVNVETREGARAGSIKYTGTDENWAEQGRLDGVQVFLSDDRAVPDDFHGRGAIASAVASALRYSGFADTYNISVNNLLKPELRGPGKFTLSNDDDHYSFDFDSGDWIVWVRDGELAESDVLVVVRASECEVVPSVPDIKHEFVEAKFN